MNTNYCCLVMLARVYNNEKRVSNRLYNLCKMFSESHVPGIHILANESMLLKYLIVGVAVQANESTILSKNTERMQCRTSVRVESHKNHKKCIYLT